MQCSGGHTEGQQLKAGWLGFLASIATGIGGCVIGRYVNTVCHTGVASNESIDIICI